MAKSKSAGAPCAPSTAERNKWDAEDGLRTLQRAEELKHDKPLMKDIAKLAQEKAEDAAKVASNLAKQGLISDKAMSKLKKEKANG